MKRNKLISTFFVFIVLFISNILVFAQNPSKTVDDNNLKEILNELKQIKQALNKFQINNFRSQIIIERLRLQNDRILKLSDLQEKAKSELESITRVLNSALEQIK